MLNIPTQVQSMFTTNSVAVVTAATGHRNLGKCLESVQRQTFGDVRHWVVADGRERLAAVEAAMGAVGTEGHPRHLITLPEATGKDDWCGHRIYAAASFLVNTEFVCFLDEDNWFEPDHVASLVAAIRATGSTWGFALRNIVGQDGKFIVRDVSESLGNLHHVFNDKNEFLIDTNCYMLPREMAVATAAVWYSPTVPPPPAVSPDRAMCRRALAEFPRVCSNRKHTVNYTVGTRGAGSVGGEFFVAGFQAMRMAYPAGLPWERRVSESAS
jgi:hypothetical protein